MSENTLQWLAREANGNWAEGGGGRGGGKGWWGVRYLANSAKPALTKKGVLTVF